MSANKAIQDLEALKKIKEQAEKQISQSLIPLVQATESFDADPIELKLDVKVNWRYNDVRSEEKGTDVFDPDIKTKIMISL